MSFESFESSPVGVWSGDLRAPVVCRAGSWEVKSLSVVYWWRALWF